MHQVVKIKHLPTTQDKLNSKNPNILVFFGINKQASGSKLSPNVQLDTDYVLQIIKKTHLEQDQTYHQTSHRSNIWLHSSKQSWKFWP